VRSRKNAQNRPALINNVQGAEKTARNSPALVNNARGAEKTARNSPALVNNARGAEKNARNRPALVNNALGAGKKCAKSKQVHKSHCKFGPHRLLKSRVCNVHRCDWRKNTFILLHISIYFFIRLSTGDCKAILSF
jgi:hypothetical protein